MSSHEIRFIDPNYKTLFMLPDGGHVVITYPNGDERVCRCKYLDQTHFSVDNQVMHMCQHAEILQRLGATIAPETEPEIIAGFHILERRPAGRTVIKLGHNPRTAEPWVTWQGYPDDPGNVDHGHYYCNKRDAETDLLLRTESKRSGKPYEKFHGHDPIKKDRGLER